MRVNKSNNIEGAEIVPHPLSGLLYMEFSNIDPSENLYFEKSPPNHIQTLLHGSGFDFGFEYR